MRYLLVLLFLTLSVQYSCARELYVSDEVSIYDTLSDLEQQVYSKNYNEETFGSRMDRLETSIYGHKIFGSSRKRLDLIKESMKNSRTENGISNQAVIFNLLENRFFNSCFENENMDFRLIRLEKYVFGTVRRGSFSDRYNNLIQNVPVNSIGFSVTGSSGDKVTYKANRPKTLSPLSGIKYTYSEGNYFYSMENDTGFHKWKDFPVYIYLNGMTDKNFTQAAQNAVNSWKKYIQVELTESSEIADIIIDSSNSADTIIESVIKESGDLIIIHAGKFKNSPYLQKMLAHEIGHAVGIWGHSDNINDIMFNYDELYSDLGYSKQIKKQSIELAPDKPTVRDINTLIRVYDSH